MTNVGTVHHVVIFVVANSFDPILLVPNLIFAKIVAAFALVTRHFEIVSGCSLRSCSHCVLGRYVSITAVLIHVLSSSTVSTIFTESISLPLLTVNLLVLIRLIMYILLSVTILASTKLHFLVFQFFLYELLSISHPS